MSKRKSPTKSTQRDYWPSSLAHLARPYVESHDEYIIVSEISSEPVEGLQGVRQLYTALIPVAELDTVLAKPGGIGWEVKSWGPGPEVPPEGGWDGRFWIQGPSEDKRYEALVHGWSYHNKVVMIPDNGFLMCYGLVPRFFGNEIRWDDPAAPFYDVVEARPLSTYDVDTKYSGAIVRVAREYLEDYASLKGCALVAVFCEERFSKDVSDIDVILGASQYASMELPGRRIQIKRLDLAVQGANQFSQVWGCRLILKPDGRPVSEPKELFLQWPDFPRPTTSENVGGFDHLENVYVSDEVLTEWQGRDEFTIYPKSGGVSYNGWWGTGETFRVGRNHLAINLRHLYEGTPQQVIKHFYKFAVPKKQAESDSKKHGERNIGLRADQIIWSYLRLTKSLANLADRLSLVFNQIDLCELESAQVRYYDWWTIPGLSELGYVAPMSLTQDQFLDRCVLIYQLFERTKPGPLKQILQQLGMQKTDFQSLGEVRSLKLLATICQFAALARTSGVDLVDDFITLKSSWNNKSEIPSLNPLFALIQLRNLRSHPQGPDRNQKIDLALKSFGVNSSGMKKGWGLAIDQVYDRLTSSFVEIRKLIDTTS